MSSCARRLVWPFAFALVLASPLLAQFSNPEPATTQVHNAAPLRPPAGARVAIVEWEDLQCPDCARANPVIEEAAEKYSIPWVRHDFPLPFHTWSFAAAVDARWFDTRSRTLGDTFRDAVFAAQPTIRSEDNLRSFAAGFARQHGMTFPSRVDPQGRLADLVKADYALGQSVGVQHTPTIWVVAAHAQSGAPFVEVIDQGRLNSLIETALAESGPRQR